MSAERLLNFFDEHGLTREDVKEDKDGREYVEIVIGHPAYQEGGEIKDEEIEEKKVYLDEI